MLVLVASLSVVLVLVVAGFISLAVLAAARRAGEDRARARGLAIRVAAALGAWLALIGALGASGALSSFDARPPRLMLVPLGAVVGLVILTRTATYRRLLEVASPSWPIAIQAMRVPIELGLWALFAAGRLPVHLTFEGRNVDVLVGLTAPVVAVALSRGWIGARAAALWNVASLGALANIVFMAITSLPGPLHLPWPGVPNTVVAEFPFVWLPGFLVPVALFGHVASLRQLLPGRRGSSGHGPRWSARAASERYSCVDGCSRLRPR